MHLNMKAELGEEDLFLKHMACIQGGAISSHFTIKASSHETFFNNLFFNTKAEESQEISPNIIMHC